jgi:anti-sigma factor RsiW
MTEHQHHHEEHEIQEERQSCHDLLRSLSDYVDGTLDESICAEIEKHMAECDRCHIVIDTLRKTVELYRTLPAPPLPDDVHKRLLLRLNLDDYTLEKKSPAK